MTEEITVKEFNERGYNIPVAAGQMLAEIFDWDHVMTYKQWISVDKIEPFEIDAGRYWVRTESREFSTYEDRKLRVTT